MLASYYFKKKEYDKMEEIFEEAIKVNKKIPLLYNMYGWCLTQIGKNDKAISVLQRGLTAIPNNKNLTASLTNLQNKKKIKLNSYGDGWYQFRLEKHPQEIMAQKQMFKKSKKQTIKRM